jgi:hypothetical protein
MDQAKISYHTSLKLVVYHKQVSVMVSLCLPKSISDGEGYEMHVD